MATNKRPYHEQIDLENTKKLRELMDTLPSFTKDFFRGIEPVTASRTRIAYAYDLRVFFDFLINNNSTWGNKGIDGITLSDLDQITLSDLEEYAEHLKYYDKDDEDHINKERGIKRKLS